MAGAPTVAEVREWLKVSPVNVSDHDLTVIHAAEVANQYGCCRIPDPANLHPDLIAAIYRRCARQLAARGVPLGLTSGGEQFGPSRLPSFDAEIERMEGEHRKFVFG